MAKIKSVAAREILDSRGNPTIEVDVGLDDGSFGRAGIPSGASTGAHEAVELRDGEKNRYQGNGVRKAVSHVRESLGPKVIGMNASEQTELDHFMIKLDGTENKERFGANAILGVSLAVAKANAASQKLPVYKSLNRKGPYKLPVPLMNVINGGAHADNGLDVQEFMIIPVCGGKFSETLRAGSEIFHTLKSDLKKKGLSTGVGDEGGFAPTLKSNLQALELIAEAITKAGYKLGEEVLLGLDVAATELYDTEKKLYRWEGKSISAGDLIGIYNSWSKNFPLISIEDGLSEDDWQGWKEITTKLGKDVQLVGDDVFVTNIKRLKRGIDEKVANSILVKVNQIGTLTETLDTVHMAQDAKYHVVFSHRSGETEDSTISDLAVACNAQQIKTGSLCRGERIAKYNQLLRIEEELGSGASFWGKDAFKF